VTGIDVPNGDMPNITPPRWDGPVISDADLAALLARKRDDAPGAAMNP